MYGATHLGGIDLAYWLHCEQEQLLERAGPDKIAETNPKSGEFGESAAAVVEGSATGKSWKTARIASQALGNVHPQPAGHLGAEGAESAGSSRGRKPGAVRARGGRGGRSASQSGRGK